MNAYMKNEKELFLNYDRMRFPLMIMVVFIHARFSSVVYDNFYFNKFQDLFSSIIPSIAVPLFFLISGCLYFRDKDNYTITTYLHKTRRRIKNLLFPFLLWNAFFWIVFTLFQLFFPSLLNGGIPSLIGATYSDVLWVFWGDNTGGPIDFPLWFIRDLILVTLFAPAIFYLFLKYKVGVFFLIVLGLFWVCDYPISFFGNDIKIALLFFALGGYLSSLSHIKVSRCSIVFFVLLCLLQWSIKFFVFADRDFIVLLTAKASVMIGIVATYSIVCLYPLFFDYIRRSISSNCIFFIYATHGFIITLMIRVIESLGITNLYILYVLYFADVLISILICIFFYRIINHFAPALLNVFTGKR